MSGGSPHPGAIPIPDQRTVVVALPGEVDVTNDGEVLDALVRALSDGAVVLVADGSEVAFCGSSGVAALLAVHREAAAAGTQLRVAASPVLRRVLRLIGADHVLNTYPTLAAALAEGTAPPA
jgi:anti-sigma B factor antagonist